MKDSGGTIRRLSASALTRSRSAPDTKNNSPAVSLRDGQQHRGIRAAGGIDRRGIAEPGLQTDRLRRHLKYFEHDCQRDADRETQRGFAGQSRHDAADGRVPRRPALSTARAASASTRATSTMRAVSGAAVNAASGRNANTPDIRASAKRNPNSVA